MAMRKSLVGSRYKTKPVVTSWGLDVTMGVVRAGAGKNNRMLKKR